MAFKNLFRKLKLANLKTAAQEPASNFYILCAAYTDRRSSDGVLPASRNRLFEALDTLATYLDGKDLTVLASCRPSLEITRRFALEYMTDCLDTTVGQWQLEQLTTMANITSEAQSAYIRSPNLVLLQILNRADIRQLLTEAGQQRQSRNVAYGSLYKYERSSGRLTMIHHGTPD